MRPDHISTAESSRVASSARKMGRVALLSGLRPAPTHPENTLHLASVRACRAQTVDEYTAGGGVVEVLR